MAQYDAQNREIPDPTPVALPPGYQTRAETLQQLIQRMVRNENAIKQAFGEVETEEEADDFDVDDEEGYILESGHEVEPLLMKELCRYLDVPGDKTAGEPSRELSGIEAVRGGSGESGNQSTEQPPSNNERNASNDRQ